MNFNHLEYFIMTAHDLNFTKAAAHLHVTQQTLSASIASLEQELSVQLFIRSSPLELTLAGRRFLEYAEKTSENLLLLKQSFSYASDNPLGELRVGISHSRAMTFLPDVINNFKTRFPNIYFDISEAHSLNKRLLDNELDIGINSFSSHNSLIEYIPFADERVALVMSQNLMNKYSLTENMIQNALDTENPADLVNLPIITGYKDGGARTSSESFFSKCRFSPVSTIHAEDFSICYALAIRDTGAYFMSMPLLNFLMPAHLHKDLLSFPLPSAYDAHIEFAYSKRNPQKPIIDIFLEESKHIYFGNTANDSLVKKMNITG